jgi:hypothetical protein
MSISFHCESCKKKIKAPDDAGGKWGSCPHCNHKCYIPSPPAEDDEKLTLIPMEEGYEENYKKMMRETYGLTQNILGQTDVPEDDAPAAAAPVTEKELIKDLVAYLRLMADGELSQAETVAKKNSRVPKNAKRLLAKMLKAERPEPELQDIPERLLRGLIKDLGKKL